LGRPSSGRATLRIQRITTDPDPYEPFRLALGYRVGDLIFVQLPPEKCVALKAA